MHIEEEGTGTSATKIPSYFINIHTEEEGMKNNNVNPSSIPRMSRVSQNENERSINKKKEETKLKSQILFSTQFSNKISVRK